MNIPAKNPHFVCYVDEKCIHAYTQDWMLQYFKIIYLNGKTTNIVEFPKSLMLELDNQREINDSKTTKFGLLSIKTLSSEMILLRFKNNNTGASIVATFRLNFKQIESGQTQNVIIHINNNFDKVLTQAENDCNYMIYFNSIVVLTKTHYQIAKFSISDTEVQFELLHKLQRSVYNSDCSLEKQFIYFHKKDDSRTTLIDTKTH